MIIKAIILFISGLGLFLYGMNMMSTNLEEAVGGKMEIALKKLTNNSIMGVLTGTVITALVHSSTAITVMVVGFVDNGIMTLTQAVWVILGANIGTTVTSQMAALQMGMIAPIIAILGMALMITGRKERVKCIGGVFSGLGVLFIGMEVMQEAMIPFRNANGFVQLMTGFGNPLMGIFGGAIFTAVIQSSSASIAILQSLAMNGMIDLTSAIYIVFGQNVGTCVTAMMASIGAGLNAKRTALVHFIINILGVIVFAIICMITPFNRWIASTAPNNPAMQIATAHVIFNIASTIFLIPFVKSLDHIAEWILPDQSHKNKNFKIPLQLLKN